MPAHPPVDRMFKAFADETRLRILHLLTHGELCVCDLRDALKLSQPKISRHLAFLKNAGLVQPRREGLWKYYALTPAEKKSHQRMIHCLKGCFDEVKVLRRDLVMLKKRIKRKRC